MNKKEFDTSGEDQKEGKVKTKDKLKGKTKKAKTGQNKESSSHSSDTQNFEKKKKKVASKKKNAEKKMKHYNGKAYDSVGAGDSLVAGFIYEYLKTKDYTKALKVGVNIGAATVYSIGLASDEEIKKALENV